MGVGGGEEEVKKGPRKLWGVMDMPIILIVEMFSRMYTICQKL